MTALITHCLVLVWIAVAPMFLLRKRPVGGPRVRYTPVGAANAPDVERHAVACSGQGFGAPDYFTIAVDARDWEADPEGAPPDTQVALLLGEERSLVLALAVVQVKRIVADPSAHLLSFATDGRAFVTTSHPRSALSPVPGVSVRSLPGAKLAKLVVAHQDHIRSHGAVELERLDRQTALSKLEAHDRAAVTHHLATGQLELRDGYAYLSPFRALSTALRSFVNGIRARAGRVAVLTTVGVAAGIALPHAVATDARPWAAAGLLAVIGSLSGALLQLGFASGGMLVLLATMIPLAAAGDLHWLAWLSGYVAGALVMAALFKRPRSPARLGPRGDPLGGADTREGLDLVMPACLVLGTTIGALLLVFTLIPLENLPPWRAALSLAALPLAVVTLAAWGILGILSLKRARDDPGRRIAHAISWIPALAFLGLMASNRLGNGADDDTLANAQSIAAALEQHHDDFGSYPPALDALVPRYLDGIPLSIVGWHERPFRYEPSPVGYELSYASATGRMYYWWEARAFLPTPRR